MDINNILHFLNNFKEPNTSQSDIKKIQRQMKSLSQYSLTEANSELIVECILKYIDCIINIASNKSFKNQIKICNRSFEIITEIVSEHVQATFVKVVTKRIFDIIIDDDVQRWCIKKELLKAFIGCIKNVDKTLSQKTVQDLPDIYLFKLVDSISTYSDYDLQLTLIETVFRMYGKITVMQRLKDLIPESEELRECFANINGETFDEDVRRFLNLQNIMSQKVFSVICRNVHLGNLRCEEPMDNIDGLWVDFNLSENAITWYCNKSSFNNKNGDTESLNESEERVWNLITLFTSDVDSVQIHRPIQSEDVLIYFKLNDSCISSFDDNQTVVGAADNLKLVVSYNSNKIANLLSNVLPYLFKNKFYHNSAKVSSSKKHVYKPLRVTVSKKDKKNKINKSADISSKSRSDSSSFVTFFDPMTGRFGRSEINSSRDDTSVRKAVSVSSASTKCDVISIPDSSSHSTGLSLELIPSKHVNTDIAHHNTENSQYETAQICPDSHTYKNPKVSKNIKSSVNIENKIEAINESENSNYKTAEFSLYPDRGIEKKTKVSRSINIPSIKVCDQFAPVTEKSIKCSTTIKARTRNPIRSREPENQETQISNTQKSNSNLKTEISKNTTGLDTKEITSDTSKPSVQYRSFDEDLRTVQEDINYIQILSGRCSGSSFRYSQISKSSARVSSTPKKSSDSEIKTLNESPKICKDKKPQSSSSGNYETAKECSHSVTNLPRESRETETTLSDINSMKVNIFKDKGTEYSEDVHLSSESTGQNIASEYFRPIIATNTNKEERYDGTGVKAPSTIDNVIEISEDFIKPSQDLFVMSDKERHDKNLDENNKESVIFVKAKEPVCFKDNNIKSKKMETVTGVSSKCLKVSSGSPKISKAKYSRATNSTISTESGNKNSSKCSQASSNQIKISRSLFCKAVKDSKRTRIVEDVCSDQVTDVDNSEHVLPTTLNESKLESIFSGEVEELTGSVKISKPIPVKSLKKKQKKTKKTVKDVDDGINIIDNIKSPDAIEESNNKIITSSSSNIESQNKAKEVEGIGTDFIEQLQTLEHTVDVSNDGGDLSSYEVNPDDVPVYLDMVYQELPITSTTRKPSGENDCQVTQVENIEEKLEKDGKTDDEENYVKRHKLKSTTEMGSQQEKNIPVVMADSDNKDLPSSKMDCQIVPPQVSQKSETLIEIIKPIREEDVEVKQAETNLEKHNTESKSNNLKKGKKQKQKKSRIIHEKNVSDKENFNPTIMPQENTPTCKAEIGPKLYVKLYKISELPKEKEHVNSDPQETELNNISSDVFANEEESLENDNKDEGREPLKEIYIDNPVAVKQTEIEACITQDIKTEGTGQKEDANDSVFDFVKNERKIDVHRIALEDYRKAKKEANKTVNIVEENIKYTTNKSCHNQTLSTTLSTRRRRKLYNPLDLSYWQDTIVDDCDPTNVTPNEPSTSVKNVEVIDEGIKHEPVKKPRKSNKVKKSTETRKSKKSKKEPNFNVTKKFKFVNPDVMLKIPNESEKLNYSRFRPVFHSMVESFRQDNGKSFYDIIEKNTPKEELSKSNKKKRARRYTKHTMKPKHMDRVLRTENESLSASGSGLSLHLKKSNLKPSKATPYSSPVVNREAAPVQHDEGVKAKKIHIIANVQIRSPKRALSENNSEMPKKKIKQNENKYIGTYSQETLKLNYNFTGVENGVSGIVPLNKQLPITSENITNEEISRWIATGSPKYNKSSECRYVLKHAYPMFNSLYNSAEGSQEREDIINICSILEKYL